MTLLTGGARYLDKGVMPVVVFQGIRFDPCEANLPIYATGTMQVVLNEHVSGENGGTSTFGIRGSGTVTTTAGDAFLLHDAAMVVFLPNGGVHDPGSHIKLTPLD